MGFTIPNPADAVFLDQAMPNSTDFDILQLGFNGNGVIDGCGVTPHSPVGMSVDVAGGNIFWNGSPVAVSSANPSISAAGSNPRRDLIVVSSTGTISVVTGTGQAADPNDPYVVPLLPAVPANSLALAAVDVPASVSSILATMIIDKRIGTFAQNVLAGAKDVGYYRHVGTSPFERYYGGVMHDSIGQSTTSVLGQNTLFALPYPEMRGGTIDRMAIDCRVSGTGNVRLGIYQATTASNIYPGALVLDAGTATLGATGVRSVTISQVLAAGILYWLAAVFDTGTGTITYHEGLDHHYIMGKDNPNNVFGSGISTTHTFGVLPSTFPAGASISDDQPVVGVRYSA